MARSAKLSEEITKKIQRMIQENMKPGDKLPTESDLCEIMGVSRTTIRECLAVLTSQGVLVNKKGGKYVNSSANECYDSLFHTMLNMDICSMSDILQVRNLLEVDVVSIVANNLSDDTILELERILWELQNPDISEEDFNKTEVRFHYALAHATNNKFLVDLLTSIREITVSKAGSLPAFSKAAVIENRTKLLAALKAGNRSKAVALAQEHTEKSRLFFGITSDLTPPAKPASSRKEDE